MPAQTATMRHNPRGLYRGFLRRNAGCETGYRDTGREFSAMSEYATGRRALRHRMRYRVF
ncbi:MAG: hypothetical protein GDA39_02305 [Hyphomonadaceae bacterium]|nr:hypothetical protein [Hyphomonadaceae bacterium]MBC6411804.1 hypothetical protein [Hyphomonadaceae bacterium]